MTKIIEANETPITLAAPFTPLALTHTILDNLLVYDAYVERVITNNAVPPGTGQETTTPTLCFTPCVNFAPKPAGTYTERVRLTGSHLQEIKNARGGLLNTTYTTQLALTGDTQTLHHMRLIVTDDLERAHDIHPYLQLERMFAECRVAHKTIASEITNVTSFPVAFQVVEETKPDFVMVSPGRAIDGENLLNHQIGIKVYRGQFGEPGWIRSPSQNPPGALWFSSIFDTQMLIPWGRERLFMYILFEKSTSAVTSAKLSFSIVPYSEIK